MKDMTMKEMFVKWMPVLARACFAAAVFLIADGHFPSHPTVRHGETVGDVRLLSGNGFL